jgi:hypothetical protein
VSNSSSRNTTFWRHRQGVCETLSFGGSAAFGSAFFVNREYGGVEKKLRLRMGWLSEIPRAKLQPANWMRVRGEQVYLVRD